MSGKGPSVVDEDAEYKELGTGPLVDAGSFDKRTPLGGDGYREMQQRAPAPRFVVDDSDFDPRTSTPAGMLSRAVVNKREYVDPEEVAGKQTRLIIAGAGALLVLLFVGAMGLLLMNSSNPAAAIAGNADAVEGAAPVEEDTPESVQGVKIRKGIAKDAEPTEEEPDDAPAVPDGTRSN